MGKRYITYYGYFGPTTNVKNAPAALTPDAVARVLSAMPSPSVKAIREGKPS